MLNTECQTCQAHVLCHYGVSALVLPKCVTELIITFTRHVYLLGAALIHTTWAEGFPEVGDTGLGHYSHEVVTNYCYRHELHILEGFNIFRSIVLLVCFVLVTQVGFGARRCRAQARTAAAFVMCNTVDYTRVTLSANWQLCRSAGVWSVFQQQLNITEMDYWEESKLSTVAECCLVWVTSGTITTLVTSSVSMEWALNRALSSSGGRQEAVKLVAKKNELFEKHFGQGGPRLVGCNGADETIVEVQNGVQNDAIKQRNFFKGWREQGLLV